ncbi:MULTISPECIES: UPF0146 family protein [Haloferax]|uniref:UPF0146 protein GJR98_01475 n=2 Tax=Haloferax TaxID=2251 RepID=A0A6G1YZ23_9EURY|nr:MULTISPECIES: UPF0146 family protein [Haloferax]KAB1186766.1 hypothetical protein Hfx1149_01480 [Haloferax sp. CBA1149]MRW79391.1 hypothetical protein [Haloferax marinisediminis]
MRGSLRDALVTRLTGYDRVVEVGIGRETDVAAELAARGVDVVAVDVYDVPVPDGVRFVRDDVVARSDAPDLGPYEGVDAVYALNFPVELHSSAAKVARRAGAAFCFTTLGYDEPSIPVRRESLPGDTVFVAEDGPGSRR